MKLFLCFRIYLCMVFLLLGMTSISQTIVITGRIISSADQGPVADASLRLLKSRASAVSATDGTFRISGLLPDTLIVSRVGYSAVRLYLTQPAVVISMRPVAALDEVVVETGYQTLPKERVAGSFVQIDNALLNRSVSTNILDRINGVSSGILFTPRLLPGSTSSDNKAAISIRGRATLGSNPNPLIILDNFPYEGSLDNINPNDVESVTILKDAAAASIWGALAGNGVIVITTKKGRFNQPMQVSLNLNTTFVAKPNLYYALQLGTSDFIDVEQFLFAKGAYASTLNSAARPPVTPVVELLARQAAGLIPAADATARINELRTKDIRKDLERYLYRAGINQQYAINFSGGSRTSRYLFAMGYDRNLAMQIGNDFSRYTLNGQHTIIVLPEKLELTTGFAFTQTRTGNNYQGLSGNYPYLQLADDAGNALAVPRVYRQGYIDTAGQGKLMDWNYRPLDELYLASNYFAQTDNRISLQLKYKPISNLDINVQYQLNKGNGLQEQYYNPDTWFTRNLVNQFSQVNFTTGSVLYKIPAGGILDRTNNNYQSQNGRIQISYDRNWGVAHSLTGLAGWEIRSFQGTTTSGRLYGYNKELGTSSPVDYTGLYPLYQRPGVTNQVPYIATNLKTINNYLSYFANGAYTFRQRYTVSASIRKDESNIFGVTANLKGVPLYSFGLSWLMSREPWYRLSWLNHLKLRLTDGYAGNVNPNLSAYTTASYGINNIYGAVQASLVNPPNPSLSWEKVHTTNMGIDFTIASASMSGSIESYMKKGSGLIAQAPIDPTTGVTTFTGNTADLVTKGIDVVLNTRIFSSGKFTWSNQLLFNYVTDKVTRYLVKKGSIGAYLIPGVLSPLEGKPVYAVYSYKWAGLDNNGDPQGILDDKISQSYSSFSSSTDFNNLAYSGRATPSFFGSLRNSVQWGNWGFSLNVLYKFGYVFRDVSLNYATLFNVNGGSGHPDYALRWQKPGDEQFTNVPAMVYPVKPGRDAIYTNSNVLVYKADHIRLQDLQVSYDLPKALTARLHLKSVRCYGYISNIGLLWRSNTRGVDPDTGPMGIPVPRSYAMGIKVDF